MVWNYEYIILSYLFFYRYNFENFIKRIRNIGSFLIIYIFIGICKFILGIVERRGKRLVYRFKYMY